MAEIVRRWGTSNPTLNQAVTIIFLSDQPGFTDPVDTTPISNQVNLTIIGTPTVLASGTITTYTARSYTTGVLDNFTSAAIPDFTPYTDLMIQTSGGATFWVSTDETTANSPAPTAYISAPMQTIVSGSGAFLAPGDPSTPVPPPPWVTPHVGDTFNILQPCKVYVTRRPRVVGVRGLASESSDAAHGSKCRSIGRVRRVECVPPCMADVTRTTTPK